VRRIGTFIVPSTHPSLPGHFPGRPVIPGVVLLDELLAAVAQATGLVPPLVLQRVKFEGLAPIDEPVTVLIEEQDGTSLRFCCEAASRRIITGSLATDAARAR
jgi:3-hydroxymyristoyl/3-hydroxydecanoyl-(acyl carrier protein) dehydratase